MATKQRHQPAARDVPLREIRVLPAFQVRERLHGPTIERYAEILDRLPPVDLFEIDGKLLLVDGFHRVAAHCQVAKAHAKERAARLTTGSAERAARERQLAASHPVRALVHEGSRAEALKHAAEANVARGRELGRWDLYAAIAMRHGAERISLRALAGLMGTNHETVRTALIVDRMLRVAPAEGVKRLTTREIAEVAGADEGSWPDLIEETLARRHESARPVSPQRALTGAIVALYRLQQHVPERVVEGMVSKRAALLVDELDRFISVLGGIRKEAEQRLLAAQQEAAG